MYLLLVKDLNSEALVLVSGKVNFAISALSYFLSKDVFTFQVLLYNIRLQRYLPVLDIRLYGSPETYLFLAFPKFEASPLQLLILTKLNV